MSSTTVRPARRHTSKPGKLALDHPLDGRLGADSEAVLEPGQDGRVVHVRRRRGRHDPVHHRVREAGARPQPRQRGQLVPQLEVVAHQRLHQRPVAPQVVARQDRERPRIRTSPGDDRRRQLADNGPRRATLELVCHQPLVKPSVGVAGGALLGHRQGDHRDPGSARAATTPARVGQGHQATPHRTHDVPGDFRSPTWRRRR